MRRMKVAILDLGRFKYGGIPTYSYHLKSALEINGCRVTVLSHRMKCFIDKRIRMGDLLIKEINDHDVLLINGTFIDKKDYDRICGYLIKVDIPIHIIVHDPAEKLDLLGHLEIKSIITISKYNARHFVKCTDSVPVQYTIHPYKRWSGKKRNAKKKKTKFISTSRVDFDKYYENILRAADKGYIPNYEIHTGYVHRPYVYFKLDKKKITPVDWQKKYYINYVVGGFEFNRREFRRVYDKALALIDLSFIKNDGARSQYTFLEAFDFGVCIILSEKWDPKEKYWVHGKNCLKVDPDSVKSIRKVVKKLIKNDKLRERLINNGYRCLRKHNHEKIGRKFLEIINGW